MTKLKNFASTLWKDESGQGTAEYVLLLAIVAGLVLLFKDKIIGLVKGKLDQVGGAFDQVSPTGN
jgi:Flp pilus assembly pilin Flp